MLKRVLRESNDSIPGLVMDDSEQIVLCLHTDREVRNPMDQNEKYPETALITNRRLVVLARHSYFKDEVTFTSMPLDNIQVVQTTNVSWTLTKILASLVAFLFYIVPGIIFLIHMHYAVGASVNVASGGVRTVVRFHPRHKDLLQQFVAFL